MNCSAVRHVTPPQGDLHQMIERRDEPGIQVASTLERLGLERVGGRIVRQPVGVHFAQLGPRLGPDRIDEERLPQVGDRGIGQPLPGGGQPEQEVGVPRCQRSPVSQGDPGHLERLVLLPSPAGRRRPAYRGHGERGVAFHRPGEVGRGLLEMTQPIRPLAEQVGCGCGRVR